MIDSARHYHHGHLREAVLTSALELGRVGGPQAIGVRELARRAGVTATAIYRHFEDHDAILRAVAQVVMADLHEAMLVRMARVRASDPTERARLRLRAIGEAYLAFAVDEPGLFAVAFNGPTLRDVEGPLQCLALALDECLEAGYLDPDKRRGADLICWSTVHGFAMLYGAGPLRSMHAMRRADEFARLLDGLEEALKA